MLHTIESGRVREVGGIKENECSVRLLITATNRPLEQALREGRFRADLYHRVNVLRIDIPPLRERPEDVEVLVDVLLERASGRVGREPVGLSRASRTLAEQVMDADMTLEQLERHYLKRVLEKTGGNSATGNRGAS